MPYKLYIALKNIEKGHLEVPFSQLYPVLMGD